MVYCEEYKPIIQMYTNQVKSFSSRAHIRGYPYLSKCTEALKPFDNCLCRVDFRRQNAKKLESISRNLTVIETRLIIRIDC
jgi:hypothetical protein